MQVSFTAGPRTNWTGANQCGQRQWTGPAPDLTRRVQAHLLARPCELCHLSLSRLAHATTHYHKHCSLVIKRRQQKAHQRRVAQKAMR